MDATTGETVHRPVDIRIEDELLENNFDTRPVVDRYYVRHYLMGPRQDDYAFLIHSNKLCVLTLADSHPIKAQNLTVSSLKFQVSEKLDRVNNHVVGKGKKGAQILNETSTICVITCENLEKPFKIPAGMNGKLLEVNEGLLEKPDLLKSPEWGYIAIISPRTSDFERQIGKLVTEEEYLTRKEVPIKSETPLPTEEAPNSLSSY